MPNNSLFCQIAASLYFVVNIWTVMWERPHVADIVFINIIIDFFEELPQGI